MRGGAIATPASRRHLRLPMSVPALVAILPHLDGIGEPRLSSASSANDGRQHSDKFQPARRYKGGLHGSQGWIKRGPCQTLRRLPPPIRPTIKNC